jgi:hypothetical protein
MKNKLPLLTVRELEESTVLVIKLNFVERGEIISSIGDAVISRDKAWQKVAYMAATVGTKLNFT